MSQEYNVISCNRQELDIVDSTKVYNYIKSNKFDVIIHAATYDAAPRTSTKDPTKVLESNLRMFFNIIRCKDYYNKMIYFGSGAEFNRENWIPKMKEDYFEQHIPTDQYGYSKYIMTKYTELADNVYNLRLFGTFGRYEDWRYRFISNACSYAVLDLPITINRNVYFDYLYIDDLVKIVQWFIKYSPKRKVFNTCSGTSYSLKTLAEKVIKASSKKLDIVIKDENPGKEYSGDNTLLLKELKNFKFTPMDEAIKSLYQWYEQNKSIIDKDQLLNYFK